MAKGVWAIKTTTRLNHYQHSGRVEMNGNSECNTIAASLGEYVAQANQLGPKIGSRPEVLCIHRIKRKKLSY